ncbi:MAG: hypothetical protein OHK0015_28320 [Chloroflexi bacterium OHK40]
MTTLDLLDLAAPAVVPIDIGLKPEPHEKRTIAAWLFHAQDPYSRACRTPRWRARGGAARRSGGARSERHVRWALRTQVA